MKSGTAARIRTRLGRRVTACRFREDTRAPESRPSSRHSSLRSVLGYRPHAGIFYSSVQNHKPGARGSARDMVYTGVANGTAPPAVGAPPPGNGTALPGNGGFQPSRLDYDHEYGYPV